MNWISVKERLPEQGEIVLTHSIPLKGMEKYRMCTGSIGNSFWILGAVFSFDVVEEVTHWAELPEGPKTDEK